jgi:EF hand
MKYIILLVTFFVTSVFAQATKGIGATMEGAPGMRPTASMDARINRLDKNKDGQISRSEASGYPKLSKAFNRLDVNKDEQLSREELMAFKDKAKAKKAAKQSKQSKQQN